MKAVAYCRVSTNSEDQLNSFQNQIDYFENQFAQNKYEKSDTGILCKRDGNVFLEGIYADEGISGTSLKKREAFKQMLKDAKLGKFNIILTKSVARFGRSVEDLTKTLKDLKEIGVGVYFLDLQVNSLDNSREFLINIFASLAQEESNNKSFIVKFGIKKAQEQGKWIAPAPYGYDKIEGRLVVNDREANIINNIFHLYFHQNMGCHKIAVNLNEKGIPTKRNGKWIQPTISRILENPIYTGRQVQHTITSVDINRKTKKKIDESEWIINQYENLRIIPEELFALVQVEKQKRADAFGQIDIINRKIVNENGELEFIKVRSLKRGKTRHSNTFLFSNLLFCGNCGSSMRRKKRNTRDKSKNIGYFWCCAKHDTKGNEFCPYMNSYIETELIDHLKKEIEYYRGNKTKQEIYFNTYLDYKFNMNNIEERISDIDLVIEKLENKRNINFELYSDGDIKKDEYKIRNDKIESELIPLKEEKIRLINSDKEYDYLKFKFNNYLNTLENINVDQLDNSQMRKIIKKIQIVPEEREDGEIVKRIVIDWIFMDTTNEEIMSLMGRDI